MGGDNVAIEPLDVENYGTWSLRMKALLVHKGLWKAVEGSSGISTDDSDKALALIMLNVKDHHLTTLASCKTAKEAWESLKQIYQSQLNARRMQLRKELTQLKKGPTEALTVYFARARGLWTNLTVAGHTMSESETVLSVLSGLPTEYDTAVEILTTTTKDDFKMETVLGQLLQVEARHSRNDTDSGGAQALYSRSKNWAGRQGSGSYKKPQGSDNRPSHDNRPSPGMKKKDKCFFCGKLGHWESECRTKLKAQQNRTSAHAALGDHEDQAIVLTAASGGTSSYFWTVDSGAQRHITPDIQLLTDVRKLKEPVKVVFGNETTAHAHYEGTAAFLTPVGGATQKVQLANVLHVPECTVGNLFSVRQATSRGAHVTFNPTGKCTMEVNGKCIVEAHGPGSGLYYIPATPINTTTVIGATKTTESPQLWHRRFAHLGYDNLARLVMDNMVKGINVSAKDFTKANTGVCEPCVKGKQPRYPFPLTTTNKASAPLQLMHMDVCGPITPHSQGKARYLATILDDYSGLSVVKPLAHKWHTPICGDAVWTLWRQSSCTTHRPWERVP
jgi:hypothetical protein